MDAIRRDKAPVSQGSVRISGLAQCAHLAFLRRFRTRPSPLPPVKLTPAEHAELETRSAPRDIRKGGTVADPEVVEAQVRELFGCWLTYTRFEPATVALDSRATQRPVRPSSSALLPAVVGATRRAPVGSFS
jgi:hypothetical protein